MKTTLLILALMVVSTGCSKDGGGNRLMNGGEMTLPPISNPASPEPVPTDTQLPDLDETP